MSSVHLYSVVVCNCVVSCVLCVVWKCSMWACVCESTTNVQSISPEDGLAYAEDG